MPVYEYECRKCGEKFELRRGMSESDESIICPKCGAKKPRRLISLFGTGAFGSGKSDSGHSCTTPGFS